MASLWLVTNPCTGLTLFVIPAIYSYISKEGKVVSNVETALEGGQEDARAAVPSGIAREVNPGQRVGCGITHMIEQ